MTERLKSADPSKLRILEVGDYYLFKVAYPDNTLRLSTNPKVKAAPGHPLFELARWRGVAEEIRQGKFDLVVCYTRLYAPWDPRSFGRAFAVGLPRLGGPIVRTFGIAAACRTANVPLVAIDYEDSFAINRHNFRALDRCRLYFKRELPVDGWQVFFKTGHRNLPTRRIRRSARFAARRSKLRPISLGLPPAVARITPAEVEKDHDLFFAGEIAINSTVRASGLPQLEALATRGYRIDIARERIPLERYVERCARAWLTWSPEGYGWDCTRHYEAAYCRSVPVMSRATIQRHRPLLEGEHGFYYDVEGDHLTQTIVRALADKDRLGRMAAAGRAHVLAHHTVRALCDYVVAETYGALSG
jgi:Glycosyl transferases group 1